MAPARPQRVVWGIAAGTAIAFLLSLFAVVAYSVPIYSTNGRSAAALFVAGSRLDGWGAWIALIAVVAALYVAVSLYYYFRIVREMTQKPDDATNAVTMSTGWRAAVGLSAILSLALGINPEPILAWARSAIR